MKFEEHYKSLNTDEANKLKNVWEIFDIPNLSKNFLKNYIMSNLFDKGNLRKVITGENKDKFIGEKSQEYLIYKALGYEFSGYDLEKRILRNKFILFNEDIPDEIEEIVFKDLINKFIYDIEGEPIEVEATPFLKFMLMINFVSKNNLEINEIFKRINVEKGYLNRKIVLEYLQIRNLLTEDRKYIDTNRYNLWIGENITAIEDFYNFILNQLNIKRIFDVINVIAKIHGADKKEKWVSLNEIERIINEYEKEVEIAIDLGIILNKKFANKEFIKLSPETWYLVTGERPNVWCNKGIILTPLYEVFIPYNFDPFIIQVFDYLGRQSLEKDKKTILYNDDYFIISDISEINKSDNNLPASKLIEYIKKYCEDIPDIVCEEIIQESI